MRLFLAAAALLSFVTSGGYAADAAEEKRVRMKTSRQLKEILKELNIKFPSDADKDDLRQIALKYGAMAKWEALHPEKAPRTANANGLPPKMNPDNMAEILFPMLDKDQDGRLTKEELASMGGGAGVGAEDQFQSMDGDGDGFVSKREATAFFTMLSQMRDMDMPGGGPGGKMPEATKRRTPSERKQHTATESDQDDDDELPSHDEL